MRNYVKLALKKHAEIVNPERFSKTAPATEEPPLQEDVPVADEPKKGSNLDEDAVTRKYIRKVPGINKFCVDIGASDGISMSNTYKLFSSGWKGIAFECVPEKFIELAKNLAPYTAHLSNSMVTPENVRELLHAYSAPKNFGFLSLDIDGYDYYVLEKLLSEYSPTIICAEVNEKIPTPIKFSVNYNKDYFWNSTHFFGQSLAQIDDLCRKHGYVLAELHYNNVFYIKKSHYDGPHLTAEEAYRKGYRDKPDRKEKFPWNADFEDIFSLELKDQIAYIKDKFEDQKNNYTIKL